MKPPPFGYEAPDSVAGVLRLLGDDATVLAGGQSLVPLMNFRLARPQLLVDINGVQELAVLRRSDGMLRIGAVVRQAELERSPLVADGWPLLRQAARHVGHPQTRSRGTVAGSVAHADPAAELPAVLAALDARFHLASARGERTLAPHELFVGPLMTAIEPDELLVEIEVPPLPSGARGAFVEQARTHGDFAVAGAAVVLAPGHAAIAMLGRGTLPIRAVAAEQALLAGAQPGEAAAQAAAVIKDVYVRALAAELVRRAIAEARA